MQDTGNKERIKFELNLTFLQELVTFFSQKRLYNISFTAAPSRERSDCVKFLHPEQFQVWTFFLRLLNDTWQKTDRPTLRQTYLTLLSFFRKTFFFKKSFLFQKLNIFFFFTLFCYFLEFLKFLTCYLCYTLWHTYYLILFVKKNN